MQVLISNKTRIEVLDMTVWSNLERQSHACGIYLTQDYYYYIRGLEQSLVAAKTLQKNEIRGTIYHGL